jgi:hypothetical protein
MGMKYFLDTEFIERGRLFPVTLISIGLVSEDGREYYAISSEFNTEDASEWVKWNVIAQLPDSASFPRKTVERISREITAFVHETEPEFWAYYADYDWVVFAQMFGTMMDLPKRFPMYCHDIKQLADSMGNPKLPIKPSAEHNALEDARWNKTAYGFLMNFVKNYRLVGNSSGAGMIIDERLRQIHSEGWTSEHDDKHTNAELSSAAVCYASQAAHDVGFPDSPPLERGMILGEPGRLWPWEDKWWKPSPDPIRNLVKAGALIAAEIDRLRRKEKADARG